MVDVVSDYETLRLAVAARRRDLALTQLAVDHIAGVQSGYTGKLEVGIRHFGDVSLGPILGALGMVLRVEPSSGNELAGNHREARARLRAVMADRGRKGGQARAARQSPAQRSLSASRAAKVRWRKKNSEV